MNLRNSCLSRPHGGFEVPTVFVVDDDASTCEQIELLVRSAGWRITTMSSAEEFLAQPRINAPSCLLLELKLPGSGGLELQQRLIDRSEMPIIFMTRLADIRAIVQAMKAGALEVLAKPFAGDVLLHALRHAIARSCAVQQQQARLHALQRRYESLSRRENEVMHLVVSGRLNKQVGGELGISEITVKAHRGKLMRKMQAASFAELVNMAAALRRDTLSTVTESNFAAGFGNAQHYVDAIAS